MAISVAMRLHVEIDVCRRQLFASCRETTLRRSVAYYLRDVYAGRSLPVWAVLILYAPIEIPRLKSSQQLPCLDFVWDFRCECGNRLNSFHWRGYSTSHDGNLY